MQVVKKLLPVWFFLYVVSLATTMSGMEIFSSLLIVSVFACLVLDPPPGFEWSLPEFGRPILFFMLVAALGILVGGAPPRDQVYDLGRLRFFITYAGLFFYLRWYAPSRRSWFVTMAVVCCIIGIYGFLQHFIPMDLVRPMGKKVIMYAIPDEKLGPLVLGTFNHHLTFASVYLFYACLFLAGGLMLKPRSFFYLGLGALLSLLCLWTESRTAWIAVPIVVALLFYPLGRKWSLGAGLAIVLVICAFLVKDRGFVERFQRTFHSANEGYTLTPRTRLWKMQWELFKEAPVIGVGWNNNERNCSAYFDRAYPEAALKFCGHAHSNFLQVLSTTGLLGFAAFLTIWGLVFARLLGAYRFAPRGSLEQALSWGLFAGFVGFLIQGLTQWNFGDAEVLHNVIFFWAVAGSLPVQEVQRNPWFVWRRTGLQTT